MITNLRLENFKGHRDTSVALKQLTLLVGDNGSGKSSVLEAIRFAATYRLGEDIADLILRGSSTMRLSFANSAQTAVLQFMTTEHSYTTSVTALSSTGEINPPLDARLSSLRALLGNIGLYRFHSDQVAASAYSEQSRVSVAEDGAQTAVVLAALKLADDEAFARIEEAMRGLVPSLQRIRIKPAQVIHPSNPNPVRGSKLYFDFTAGKDVPAHHASQGTLVLLALLTVLHSADRPKTILLDDVEHALHPRAQMELIRMIKGLLARDEFQDTQIIAATHSPYVLDEVEPSNVIAFALREDGTVASKPLSEHPDAAKTNGSLKTGELWSLDAERDWVR